MGIKGDVRSMPLANVLQDLAMNEKTGTLRLRHKKEQLALWFERGGLRLVGIGPREGPSLLNGLLALQKVKPEDVPVFTGRQTSEGGLVRGLVKKGRLAKEDLKAALEHQMAEHLCDVFLWPDAQFEFEEGEPDDRAFDVDQLDLEPRLAVEATIMEAVRRADEWGETRKAILSSNEILVPDASRLPPEADGTTKRVFALLDGERSLHDVEELTRLGHFMLHRAAALLLKAGAARPLAAPEAFERARARAGKKEWEAALKMCRFALDHERKNTGLLELALRCSEALQDAESAASYARQLASAQAEAGHAEAAIESYQKVLVHAPRDLTAQERLFALMLQLDLKLDALAQGEALAAAYKKAGLPDKALEVYRQLIEKLGDQKELLENVAEIQRHLGDKKEAVALYGRLLSGALEAKDDAGALDYCRIILKVDPRHEEALRLRQELETGAVERARRRKRAIRSLAGGAVLGLLVLGALLYEYRAREHYGRLRPRINDARDRRQYREALAHYDAILDGWRWSFIARSLGQDRDDVESRYVKEETEAAAAKKEAGQLFEAIAMLDEAKRFLRRPEHAGLVSSRLSELNQLRASEEKRWAQDLARMDEKEIARQTQPLAVPGLQKLLRHDQPSFREAAVAALGAIDGLGAQAALIQALADAHPPIATLAAALLVQRKASPFRAEILAPRSQFRSGEPLPLEWRVTNLSPGEVELSLEGDPAAKFAVDGPSGPLRLPPPVPGGRRALRLGRGEFVGGLLPDVAEAASASGHYRLTWTALITWAGKPIEIPAKPLGLERTR